MSQFFVVYTIFVVALASSLFYMLIRYTVITHKLSRELKNPRSTNYTNKLTTLQYEKMKR